MIAKIERMINCDKESINELVVKTSTIERVSQESGKLTKAPRKVSTPASLSALRSIFILSPFEHYT
jgi:hypothetical protein|tara:strand:- start:369 stop:566 length:198 start_codon:yes stop_codon:yes gene_type:complete